MRAVVMERIRGPLDVREVADRVTAPFAEGCGECESCLAGDAQVCSRQRQPGFTHWGSFAEYVADTNLVAIPSAVSFEAAASLGCRFATAYRALTARARLTAGEWLTVFGSGGVGLSAVMIAKFLGARVIEVDRNTGALRAATALGADHVLLSDSGSESGSGSDSGTGDADGIPERVRPAQLIQGGVPRGAGSPGTCTIAFP
jgi:D-arabinose 1-dehydrogenase-like Zn-dependent alcohol dehydrogenase